MDNQGSPEPRGSLQEAAHARGDEDPDSRGRTEKGGTVTLLRLTYLALVPVGRILRTVAESIEKYVGGEAGGARQRVFPHGASKYRCSSGCMDPAIYT